MKRVYMTGQEKVKCSIDGNHYEYDFARMKQKNLASGKERDIRPPHKMKPSGKPNKMNPSGKPNSLAFTEVTTKDRDTGTYDIEVRVCNIHRTTNLHVSGGLIYEMKIDSFGLRPGHMKVLTFGRNCPIVTYTMGLNETHSHDFGPITLKANDEKYELMCKEATLTVNGKSLKDHNAQVCAAHGQKPDKIPHRCQVFGRKSR